MTLTPASVLDRTLVYVTGKGGVGKSTVAAALAVAAAARGKRTILCEVAEQERLSRAFAREGVGAVETELRPNLSAISIRPQAALEEWLGKQVGFGPVFRTLVRSSAFEALVAAAPGLRELITIAKVWELGQLERWTAANPTYDLVVVDAPASGHGVAMLRTPRTYASIAQVGPVNRQATKVADMLADPARTAYVAVALPEEMPVNETVFLRERLREDVGVGLDLVVVNGLYPDRFSPADLAVLRAVDGDGDGAVAGAAAVALGEAHRAHEQRGHLARLRDALAPDVPVVTLPFLFEPAIGLEQYELLAGLVLGDGHAG